MKRINIKKSIFVENIFQIKYFSEKLNSNTKLNENDNNDEQILIPNKISRKAGKKCCPYGQDGKPLTKDIVTSYLKEINSKTLIWNANDCFTRITTSLLFFDIMKAVDLIKEVYDLDERTNTKQIPNIYIKQQQILTIEMYTNLLKGLSHRDFQLSGIINEINLNKYDVVPLKTNVYEANSDSLLRKEIRAIKLNLNRL